MQKQQHCTHIFIELDTGEEVDVAKKIQQKLYQHQSQKLLTNQTQIQTMLPRNSRIPAGASLLKLTHAHEDTRVSRQYVKIRKSTA